MPVNPGLPLRVLQRDVGGRETVDLDGVRVSALRVGCGCFGCSLRRGRGSSEGGVHVRAVGRLRPCLNPGSDLTAQRDALAALGVPLTRTYVDHGLTGTNRQRPGLREALAACRSGDTLVVTKLDRLARSLPDARDILEDLTTREVELSISGSVHDPSDPVGRLLFNVLAMVAESESDLIRLSTKEGMRIAKAKGHLRGRPPKLNPRQEEHLVMLHRAGEHSTAELSDLFGVGRSTVYRVIERDGQRSKPPSAPRPGTSMP
ncbi:MAG TPA: recombinase family protein [Solirubrobacteraceae bacterium]|nr:recombinase family protein [Solirubrobacteraceae bacterium]